MSSADNRLVHFHLVSQDIIHRYFASIAGMLTTPHVETPQCPYSEDLDDSAIRKIYHMILELCVV